MLWFAVVPACIAVFLILLGVEDPKGTPSRNLTVSLRRLYWMRLGDFPATTAAWWLSGRSSDSGSISEAFLVLRAQQVGFAIQWVPLVMIVMSLAYSLSAYPAGILSDRVNRRYLLAAGIVLLIMADLVLAWAGSPSIVVVGVALWGLHMGCTQGILAAMIAEVTPAELKGTAFGLFNLASGLFMLLASMIAGGLWETIRCGNCVLRRSGAFALRLGHADFACAVQRRFRNVNRSFRMIVDEFGADRSSVM